MQKNEYKKYLLSYPIFSNPPEYQMPEALNLSFSSSLLKVEIRVLVGFFENRRKKSL